MSAESTVVHPTASARVRRADVLDAASRVIARGGDHRIRWAAIAYEVGDAQAVLASHWFDDISSLVDECYLRTAQGLGDSLLSAETAPGTALDKIAAFVVAALETRRARGVFLSFRRGGDLPATAQRRLNEHDTTVRTRLKRLLSKGRRDGSLALRNLDSAVELLLASLQVPTVVSDRPEQRMWDSELVEMLLAAVSEPHPPEAETVRHAHVVAGSCACGVVRYEATGSFEWLSACQCPVCRRHHGAEAARAVSVAAGGFRWVAGESAVRSFSSARHEPRAFCERCGSALPVVDAEAGVVYWPERSAVFPAGQP